MGTNYYAIPKLQDDLKFKIIEAVVKNQLDLAKRLMPEKVHIGKSSAGWPFLFNHNDWEYYDGSFTLGEFIAKAEIVDEYDRAINADEFIKMIDEKQKIGIEKFTTSKYNSGYIIKDGYAFSTSTEFS